MTAKEHLQTAFVLQRKIDRLTELREDIRANMYTIGSPAGQTEERVQTSVNGDRMLQLIARVDEAERDIIENMTELIEAKRKITCEIEQIPNENYRQLLYDRYIKCQRWEKIALDRNKGVRWIYRLHGKSLNAFEKVWSDH